MKTKEETLQHLYGRKANIDLLIEYADKKDTEKMKITQAHLGLIKQLIKNIEAEEDTTQN